MIISDGNIVSSFIPARTLFSYFEMRNSFKMKPNEKGRKQRQTLLKSRYSYLSVDFLVFFQSHEADRYE